MPVKILGASEEIDVPGEPSTLTPPSVEYRVKNRLIITITYDRDDKTE